MRAGFFACGQKLRRHLNISNFLARLNDRQFFVVINLIIEDDMKHLILSVAAIGLLVGSPAHAVPVNGTGLLTSDVIFGNGNEDGSWTGASGGAIEVALRGKLRYDAFGNPQNTFNYDGDRTYSFDSNQSTVPFNRSVFNFEFSVNSDTGGNINRNVNDITWNLTIDNDPTAAIFNVFDGDMTNVPFADHSFGDNSTANGAGQEASDPSEYNALRTSNNVAQNSLNLGFFSFSLDPDAPGIYTFSLSGSDSTGVLASTSIDIVVSAPAVVPLPATLPLLLGSMALFGAARRRRKN